MREVELAGVVCARICHDLASPVGAVLNGADLIRELGSADASEELALIDQSARRASALLQFHRLAFGPPRDPDAAITRGQLRERFAAILATPRVTLSWSVPAGPAIGMAAARLIALMALAGRAILGAGGELKILVPPDAALPAAVTAVGPKAAASGDQRSWLSGEYVELPDPRQVEFALIAPAAIAAGARLELIGDAASGGRLELRALPT